MNNKNPYDCVTMCIKYYLLCYNAKSGVMSVLSYLVDSYFSYRNSDNKRVVQAQLMEC